MDPALGVDRIGDGVPGSAHRIAVGLQVLDQRLNLRFVGDQEFQVVAAGEAYVAVAVLISDSADIADPVRAHQAAGTHTHRVDFIARFGNMPQQSGFHPFVILPLAVVFVMTGGSISL